MSTSDLRKMLMVLQEIKWKSPSKLDINILTWNSRGIRNKIGELELLIKCLEYTNNCKSSIKTNTATVIESNTAELGEFPHMAVLGFPIAESSDYDWKCGGSLISENYVLTAAHCSYTQNSGSPTVVRLGELNLKDDKDGADPQDIKISKIIIHPDFKTRNKYNDIGLLLLEKPVTITDRVRPVCLWQNHNLTVNNALATGWGNTAFSKERSYALQKVRLPIVSNDACQLKYTPSRRLTNGISSGLLCAGGEAGKDVCQGTAGGPLQFLDKDNQCAYRQIGIISFGAGCGVEGIPTVFTRISSYIDWIESIVWPQ